MYRGKEANTPEQRMERWEKRRKWYTAGGHESVMFLPATPGSVLAKRMQEEIDKSELKIKVIERPGMKIKKLLQKNDTNKQLTCGDDKCFVCNTTKEGSCRRTGVTYAITCRGDCDGDVYHGETHTNGYTRGIEHMNDYQFKRSQSVMWRHCLKKHRGEEQQFDMKILDYVRGDSTKRQILEAVRINLVSEKKRINDRKEWVIGKIPTMTVGEM